MEDASLGTRGLRVRLTQATPGISSDISTWRWLFGCLPSFCRSSRPGQDGPNIPAKDALRSMILLLKVLGLTYTVEKEKSCSMSLSKLYVIVITLGVNYNFWRLFAVYSSQDKFGAHLFQKILLHAFAWQVLAAALIFIFVVRTIFPHLLDSLEKYKHEFHGVSTSVMQRVAIRGIVCLISIIVVSMSAATIVVGDLFVYYYRMPFDSKREHTEFYWKIFAGLMQTVFGTILYTPLYVMVTLSYSLDREFRDITESMRAELKETGTIFIEYYRKRHLAVSKMVSSLDDMFSLYNLNAFAINVPLMCFTIYVLIYMDQLFNLYSPVISRMVIVITVVAIVVLLCGVTYCSTTLSNSAKAPLNIIYDLDLNELPIENGQGAQLQMFLTKMTTDHIGLTGWKCFNITKGSLIQVFTLVISYVVLLLRFGLTLDKRNSMTPGLPNITTTTSSY